MFASPRKPKRPRSKFNADENTQATEEVSDSKIQEMAADIFESAEPSEEDIEKMDEEMLLEDQAKVPEVPGIFDEPITDGEGEI